MIAAPLRLTTTGFKHVNHNLCKQDDLTDLIYTVSAFEHRLNEIDPGSSDRVERVVCRTRFNAGSCSRGQPYHWYLLIER